MQGKYISSFANEAIQMKRDKGTAIRQSSICMHGIKCQNFKIVILLLRESSISTNEGEKKKMPLNYFNLNKINLTCSREKDDCQEQYKAHL